MRNPVAKKAVVKASAAKKRPRQAFNQPAAKQPQKPPMFPPLNEAAMHGKLALVRKMLKGGANIEQLDNNDQSTPLILAARYNHPEIALELIAWGANVRATTRDGGTAMIWAATNDLLEVGRKMLEKGAAPEVRTKNISGRVSPAFMDMINKARKAEEERRLQQEREEQAKPLTFQEELRVAAILQKPLVVMRPLRLKLTKTRGFQRQRV